MILPDKKFEETIVGASKEMDFSIDSDNSLIFEILRDKMYKDKIGSICREVASNSRDANRESGSQEPVKITIIEPNQVVYVGHQSISFKDSGIGISPDRMADIYVKYAASTKRGDNKETGGFGLGAKTPFAYNDTFTVITVVEEGGVRKKYYYTALIDSTRKGKMVLFDEEETDEPTGTEVIVPIKTPEDRYKFEREAIYYTQSWGDGVELINFKGDKKDFEVIYEDDNVVAIKGDGYENYGLLVDGIPYPLERKYLSDDNVMSYGNGIRIFFKFNTGDLTISANRESVQYDDETIEVLKTKFDDFVETMSKKLDAYIDGIDNYLDRAKFHYYATTGNFRNVNYEDFENKEEYFLLSGLVSTHSYSNNSFLGKVYSKKPRVFNGRKLETSFIFSKHTVYRVSFNNYSERTKYVTQSSIVFSEENLNLPIYYGDVRKNVRRNRTIWDEDGHKAFYLVVPKERDEKSIVKEMEEFAFDVGFEFKLYSDVEMVEVEKESKTYEKKQRVEIPLRKLLKSFDYDESRQLYIDRDTNKIYNSLDGEDEVDLFKSIFYIVDKLTDWRYSISRDERDMIDLLAESKDVYIVSKSRYDARLSHLNNPSLKDAYNKVYNSNKEKWLEEALIYSVYMGIKNFNSYVIKNLTLFKNLLPKFVLRFDFEELERGYRFSNSYQQVENELKFDLDGFIKKIQKNFDKYPMLKYLMDMAGRWGFDAEKGNKDIQDYINLINKQNETKS